MEVLLQGGLFSTASARWPRPPAAPCGRLITSCEARRESLVVEGVHLSLNFVVKLMQVGTPRCRWAAGLFCILAVGKGDLLPQSWFFSLSCWCSDNMGGLPISPATHLAPPAVPPHHHPLPGAHQQRGQAHGALCGARQGHDPARGRWVGAGGAGSSWHCARQVGRAMTLLQPTLLLMYRTMLTATHSYECNSLPASWLRPRCC